MVCAAKVQAAYRHEITPVLCVGEGLDIREAGNHVTYTLEQLRGSISGLTAEQAKSLVIAYEPVWAIGTGQVASAEQIAAMHAFIYAELLSFANKSANIRALYGGSVNAQNAQTILNLPNVDGALVGGASLQTDSFAAIVQAAAKQ